MVSSFFGLISMDIVESGVSLRGISGWYRGSKVDWEFILKWIVGEVWSSIKSLELSV